MPTTLLHSFSFRPRVTPQWHSHRPSDSEMTVHKQYWQVDISLFPSQVPTLCLDSMVSPLFVRSWVHVCSAVTCHIHLWRNGRGLLRATVVTLGRTKLMLKWESAQKVISGKQNSPATHRGAGISNLSTTGLMLYNWAILDTVWTIRTRRRRRNKNKNSNLKAFDPEYMRCLCP